MRSCVHYIGQLTWLRNALRIFQCRLIQNPGNYAPTKNAAGNPTAFLVHKGKKETQRLSGRLSISWSFAKKLAISKGRAHRPPRGSPTKGQTYLLDCLIIQIVLERRAMCSSIAAETRKLSSASASFLISAAKVRIAS